MGEDSNGVKEMQHSRLLPSCTPKPVNEVVLVKELQLQWIFKCDSECKMTLLGSHHSTTPMPHVVRYWDQMQYGTGTKCSKVLEPDTVMYWDPKTALIRNVLRIHSECSSFHTACLERSRCYASVMAWGPVLWHGAQCYGMRPSVMA